MSATLDPAQVPAAATQVAGFLLAHVMWYASDQEEPFAPVALVVSGAERKLLVFEDDSQAGAIARGESERAVWCAESDAWAFAREALVTWGEDGGPPRRGDAMVVDFWARGMAVMLTLVHGFQRAASPEEFRLAEPRMLNLAGDRVEPAAERTLISAITEGVADHPAVAPLWPNWASEGGS